MDSSKKIILFDGICNLCNNAIRFIIERDKKDLFRYAALQSDIGRKLTAERGIDTSQVDSMILIEPGVAYYTKSTAAIEIGRTFGGAYGLLGLLQWIPEGIRNSIYDLVARNRYKWYGKQEACMVPTAELKDKFLN